MFFVLLLGMQCCCVGTRYIFGHTEEVRVMRGRVSRLWIVRKTNNPLALVISAAAAVDTTRLDSRQRCSLPGWSVFIVTRCNVALVP